MHEWRRQAKCLGMDPHLFDIQPTKRVAEVYGDSATGADIARSLCEGCPVIRECAVEAMRPLAWGTVRAGVWISDFKGANATKLREQLREVAYG
ncbi:WhiB family transcriptional regulator [Corynebacterium striatum]|uniref:WhiB family transcriptional regulator n=1 Tax=Corynebacterium striatum TaxID=43770 RepID=UPI003520B90F